MNAPNKRKGFRLSVTELWTPKALRIPRRREAGFFSGLAVLFALVFAVASLRAETAGIQAVHVRGGLPNLRAKAANGGVLRVAYLGGSITAAEGWRVHTTRYLKGLFPTARIEEIFAAVPGSGSDLGACRLERDVLSGTPDLLFVEFAVNDSAYPSELIRRSMEGIVRQTWSRYPAVDICFVYTLNADALPDLTAGRFQRAAVAMEAVAEHYGIPSVHFGPEVARRVTAGALVFKASASECSREGKDKEGRLVFTNDGVHPIAPGHELYAATLREAFPSLLKAGAPGVHKLPVPLTSKPWEKARLLPVETLERSGLWIPLQADDPRLAGQPGHLAPPTFVSDKSGSALSFVFRGTVLGLVGMKGPDCAPFEVVVDGAAPVRDTLHDAYSVPGHYRLRSWFFPRELPEGEHRVTIRVAERKDSDKGGAFLFLSGILIEGEAVASPMP